MTDTNETQVIKFSEEQAKNIRTVLLNAYEEFKPVYDEELDTPKAVAFYEAGRELAISRFLEFPFASEEHFLEVTSKELTPDDDFCNIEEVLDFVKSEVEEYCQEGYDPSNVTEDIAWAYLSVQRMTTTFEDLEIGETFFPLGYGNAFLKITPKKALVLPRLALDEYTCDSLKIAGGTIVLPNVIITAEFVGVETPEYVVKAYEDLEAFVEENE